MSATASAIQTTQSIVDALQSGHLDDAERLAREFVAANAGNEDGLILLSISLLQLDRPAEAADVCRELTRIAPNSPIYWSNLGTALRDAGELREAEEAYRRAIELDWKFFGALLNLGYLLLESGKFPEARDALLTAHRLDPTSREARIYSAQTCVALDRRDLAEKLIAPWPTWHDLSDELTVDLAGLMTSAGTPDAGGQILESLLQRSPGNLRAMANLVFLYERINRLDEARALLEKLPPPETVTDPKLQYDVISANATFALREKDPTRARELLQRLIDIFEASPAAKLTPWRSGDMYSSMAKMYDKEGNIDAAMQALALSHERQLTLARQAVPELLAPDAPPLYLGMQLVDDELRAKWPEYPAPSMLESPIFVVGFPRSGTTMLEQMLDAHPQLQSMDERAFLSNLLDMLSDFGCEYPKDLHKLTEQQCEALRQNYWAATKQVAPRKEGQRLVDKNPLQMLRLPLINRLFPNAPIIMALRHPCDSILSNYMQHFTSNSFAVLCSSLERLAQGYVNAMNAWVYHDKVLKPHVIHSRYEDLLDDFPGNIRRIADFLQLDDASPMSRFDQHARDKGFISTPSYSQVIEPPNKKAVGRWRRYHRYFEPVLPILEPMMKHWGYDA